jgi:electron transfer flavoprotein beta subunit
VNIAVCVKQIPDPNQPYALENGRLKREGITPVLDPGDEFGVEAGLLVAEAHGGEVTVVSMGPDAAGGAIRKALSMGGAKGILITDPGLENSDALSTARALAAALSDSGHDLVVCGTESTDASSGAVPAQLAELLGLPLLSFAKKLEVLDGKARIDRQTEEGYEVVEAPLPALVTVTGGINEPRYPSLRGIMQSKNKEIKQLGIADLKLNVPIGGQGLTQKVEAIAPAETRKAGRVIEDKGEAAKEIADFLAGLKVI